MQRTYKGTTVACYIGYFVQAIINNLSPILFIVYRQQLGVSLNAIGSLILINFLFWLHTPLRLRAWSVYPSCRAADCRRSVR